MIPAARPDIGDQERLAVERVLASGMLAQGQEVAAFEEEFSRVAVQGLECVAVNSGTSALHLIMLGLGIGPGDEVVVPSFTFAATANSVALTGANPIFVDIDPLTFCMDVQAVEDALTDRTKAVMPVHLYGHPAALADLAVLCQREDIYLIEDAAQAHLASLDSRPVGTWGVATAFSFYPTKNMTSGEGGMVVTRDAALARRVRLLRNQGQEQRYHNEIVGLNNRMTDVHAAIGRVQLSALHQRTAKRQENAAFLSSELNGVMTPKVVEGATHVFHQYTIRTVGHNRDRFAEELSQRGIGSGIYYPVPVHQLPAFSRGALLPETERASQQVLSLPIYPSLSRNELERIVGAVNAVASAGA